MSFTEALVDPSQPLPEDLRHAERIAVYRNNIPSALIAALAVRFPKLKLVAGDRAFRSIAGAFVQEVLPQSPVLIAYGGELAEFAARYGAAHDMPFLGDLARLENAWWEAYHAAEAQPLSPQAFAAAASQDLKALRAVFHPSVSLVHSTHAVGSLWQAGQASDSLGHAETVLVARPHAEVVVRVVSDEAALFLKLLMAGRSLGTAALDMCETYPEADAAQHLSGLIGMELIIDLKLGNLS